MVKNKRLTLRQHSSRSLRDGWGYFQHPLCEQVLIHRKDFGCEQPGGVAVDTRELDVHPGSCPVFILPCRRLGGHLLAVVLVSENLSDSVLCSCGNISLG